MSDLRHRVERLATRGTQRGADDVLQAAMHNSPLDATEPDHDDVNLDIDETDLEIVDGDDVPFVSAELDVRRQGRLRTLVAAVGVAALIGVGTLAVTAMFASGGASSPQGAVRQLADAISHKDPLAAVDVLVPSEVRSIRQTIKDATKRAADLQVINDASQPLAGVDLSVNNLQLSSQSLADGYTKVTITSGEISATTHQAAMSKLLQDVLHHSNTNDRTASADLAQLASSRQLPTFVMTVRHDGRWYVSPAYTALEYLREIANGPAADFGSAHTANLGADSPEHAVGDALHAWQAGDWNRLMALAPPDELPVYDYRAWISQEAAGTHPDFTIDTLTTSAAVNGDTAVVKLDASGTSSSGSSQNHWQVGGTCPAQPGLFGPWASSMSSSSSSSSAIVGRAIANSQPIGTLVPPVTSSSSSSSTPSATIVNGGQSSSVAGSGPSALCLAGDLSYDVPFGLVANTAGGASETGPVSIDVVRENGRWFVSPVSTVLNVIDAAIQRVDQRSIDALLGVAYQLPPDGTLTLDKPFTVPPNRGYLASSVFAFDGTKGQSVVGSINGSESYSAYAQIYTAAGNDIGSVNFSPPTSGNAYPTQLTETGSYRLVLTGAIPNGSTLTLWNETDAPKSLLGSSAGNFTCTSTPTSRSCSSATPLSTAPPTIGGASSSCAIKNNMLSCPGAPPVRVCATAVTNTSGTCKPLNVGTQVNKARSSTSSSPATVP